MKRPLLTSLSTGPMDVQHYPRKRLRPSTTPPPPSDFRTDRPGQLLPRNTRQLPLLLHPQLACPPRVPRALLRPHQRHLRRRADSALHRLCLGVLQQAESQATRRGGRGL